MGSPIGEQVLVVRTGDCVCALPLSSVEEVMRPLPTEALPGMPPFLRGLATIRGTPVPIVDLGRLFETPVSAPVNRFVLFRVDDRRAAVAVEAVPGIRELGCSLLSSLSPILDQAASALVAAVGAHDQRLVFLLQAARIVPQSLWHTLESRALTP